MQKRLLKTSFWRPLEHSQIAKPFLITPTPCPNMLRKSCCIGNTMVLALRQEVVLCILPAQIVTRSFGAWVVNFHTYPINLRKKNRNPNRRRTQSSPSTKVSLIFAWISFCFAFFSAFFSSHAFPSAVSAHSSYIPLRIPFLWPRYCQWQALRILSPKESRNQLWFLAPDGWKPLKTTWMVPTELRTHPWQVFLRSQVSIIVPAAFGTDVLPGHHAHLSATSRNRDQCPVENLLAWEIK